MADEPGLNEANLLMLGEGMVDNANKPLGNAFVLGRGSNNRETRRLLTNRPRSSFVFEKSDSKRTTTRQQLGKDSVIMQS